MRTRTTSLVILTVVLLAAGCAAADTTAGGTSDGIGVHGAWSIDVYDRDGTLAASNRFTNDLEGGASTALARLLAGEASARGWRIDLLPVLDDGEWTESPCARETPIDSHLCTVSYGDVDALAVSPVDNDDADHYVLVLRGSFEADQDGQINQVQTWFSSCPGDVSPIECESSGTWMAGIFSSTGDTSLSATPLATVNAGQTVQVEVEFSFGTLP